jgi:hypothetical protein
MKPLKIALSTIGGIVAILIIASGLQYWGLMNFKFFAPKYENAHRQVFEQTQSYVEGKRQDLTNYYDEWRKSDKDGKETIREVLLEDFANFDTSKLTPQEQQWYNQIIE